ncbi:hypothetical protein EON63_17955, partial [archaeon]
MSMSMGICVTHTPILPSSTCYLGSRLDTHSSRFFCSMLLVDIHMHRLIGVKCVYGYMYVYVY